MGLMDYVFGPKKKPSQNAFNNPEVGKRQAPKHQSASLFFKDEHEPEWLLTGNKVPQPIPDQAFSTEKPPELPLPIRQKVGRALEGRFKLSPDSHRLIALLNNPDIDAGSITQAVTKDPSLASRILKTVNSAQFGLATQVTAIGRAVVLLGFNNIRSMALSHAVSASSGNPKEAVRLRQLWMHSAMTSACAASLAKKWGGVEVGDAATAGLLIDMGKMLLKLEEAGILSAQTGLAPTVVEGYAGSCFAETWGLPQLTGKVLESSSIPFHYQVEAIPEAHRRLTLLVSFSGFVARWYGFSNGDAPEMPHSQFLESLGWSMPASGHWIENDTALELEKTRLAMLAYLG